MGLFGSSKILSYKADYARKLFSSSCWNVKTLDLTPGTHRVNTHHQCLEMFAERTIKRVPFQADMLLSSISAFVCGSVRFLS